MKKVPQISLETAVSHIKSGDT
ncbi:hypothetical protein MNBD_CHLOROFLEXI01-4748, partial [hydrothermal vent metagenome]